MRNQDDGSFVKEIRPIAKPRGKKPRYGTKFGGYVIFKYKVPVQDKIVFELPMHTEFLSVASQKDNIVLYTKQYADPWDREDDLIVRWTFRLVGTGQTIKFDQSLYKFFGTVKLHGGDLMFHLFMRPCWQTLEQPEDVDDE
jgi:hypothetical protein